MIGCRHGLIRDAGVLSVYGTSTLSGTVVIGGGYTNDGSGTLSRTLLLRAGNTSAGGGNPPVIGCRHGLIRDADEPVQVMMNQ